MLGGRLLAGCGIASLAALVGTIGRRKLLRTSIRQAEQQRIVGAEASRVATLNAATLRASISIPEAKRSFEIETANLKPFSWGIKRGPFSFVKENGPL